MLFRVCGEDDDDALGRIIPNGQRLSAINVLIRGLEAVAHQPVSEIPTIDILDFQEDL